MSINITTEELITLGRAARLIPARRMGRPTHAATLWRWGRKGVLINGRRVYLEVLRLPSGGVTTLKALQRFLDEINRDGTMESPGKSPLSADVADAINDLNADGV